MKGPFLAGAPSRDSPPIGGLPSVCSPVLHSNSTDGGVVLRNAGRLIAGVGSSWPQVVHVHSTVPYTRWIGDCGSSLSWGFMSSAALSNAQAVCLNSSFQNFRVFAHWRVDRLCDLMDEKACEMIKPSNPVTSSIPFINISFLSEIEWKPVGAMLSHPKPKHLSSSSPECPIRANVIAQIIMWGCSVCSMTEQPEWFNYTNQIG